MECIVFAMVYLWPLIVVVAVVESCDDKFAVVSNTKGPIHPRPPPPPSFVTLIHPSSSASLYFLPTHDLRRWRKMPCSLWRIFGEVWENL